MLQLSFLAIQFALVAQVAHAKTKQKQRNNLLAKTPPLSGVFFSSLGKVEWLVEGFFRQ